MNRKLLAAVTALSVVALSQTAFAAGDAKKGERIFKKCAACHAVGENAKNKLGPILNGIVGRAAGSEEGYTYSAAMKDSGLTWDEETLAKFLANPRKFMPGTKMSFSGLRREKDLANIIAFLKSHPAQ